MDNQELQTVRDLIESEKKKEAIEFAEWIKRNGYTDYGRGGKNWHTVGSYGRPSYTIEQLYNLFIQSKK